jgi:hypothetical protein
MRRALALATCADFPEGHPDDAALPAAAAAHGMRAAWAVWDDEGEDWARFDAVLLRSTWDYHERRDAFLDWARSVPRALNAPEVLAWNTDKRYLGELADAGGGEDGAPVVLELELTEPSLFLAYAPPGAPERLAAAVAAALG